MDYHFPLSLHYDFYTQAMSYIHGFSPEEQTRLISQNEVLAPYIYKAFDFKDLNHILEIGCGVGAQMMTLLNAYPQLSITGVELNEKQLIRANANLGSFPQWANRYYLLQADAVYDTRPDFPKMPDAVLLVWVLEHVSDPVGLLANIRSWVRPGTKIFITEVNHQSLHFYPTQPEILRYWEDTIRCQNRFGGNANIGMELANLLHRADYVNVQTRPQTFFLDRTSKQQRAILLEYWHYLMRSALHQTLEEGETTLERWQQAESAMYRLRENDEAVFYYSFIQAEAVTT